MSDTNWSPSYTAWKLMEAVLSSREIKPEQLGKEQLLDLYSDCVNAVDGEYIADVEDLDDELDEEDFEEDDDSDDDDE